MKRLLTAKWLATYLAVAIVAWTQFSVLSPAQGWFGRGVQGAVDWKRRASAIPPCRSDTLSELVSNHGVRIPYPSCYSVAKSEIGGYLLGDKNSSASPIWLWSREVPPGARDRFADMYSSWKGLRYSRTVSGWEISSFRRKMISFGELEDDYTTYILGQDTFLIVSTSVERALFGTETETGTLANYDKIVEALCLRNEAAGSTEAAATPLARP